MDWDKVTKDRFDQLLAKMPVFMRYTAEKALIGKLENILKKDNREAVNEKDLVDALFAETPFGFQGMMKNDLNAVGIGAPSSVVRPGLSLH